MSIYSVVFSVFEPCRRSKLPRIAYLCPICTKRGINLNVPDCVFDPC
jgi:hypothetical protein